MGENKDASGLELTSSCCDGKPREPCVLEIEESYAVRLKNNCGVIFLGVVWGRIMRLVTTAAEELMIIQKLNRKEIRY